MFVNHTSSLKNTDLNFLQPSTECYKLQILGALCLLLSLNGIFFNLTLLKILTSHKIESSNSAKPFIKTLTILNLLGCASELPLVTLSNFNCG